MTTHAGSTCLSHRPLHARRGAHDPRRRRVLACAPARRGRVARGLAGLDAHGSVGHPERAPRSVPLAQDSCEGDPDRADIGDLDHHVDRSRSRGLGRR